MGRKVRKIGMELAPKVFNELPCGILEIRHQRVTRLLHTGKKLYALKAEHGSKKNDSVTSERWAQRKRHIDDAERSLLSFIIEIVGA
jgi:hypothetical protein